MIEITGVMPLPPANATIGVVAVVEHEEPGRAQHLDGVARREGVVHPVRHHARSGTRFTVVVNGSPMSGELDIE